MRSMTAVYVWMLTCLLALASACGGDAAEQCRSDVDCAGDRMCVAGQCLEDDSADGGDVGAGDAHVGCSPGAACFPYEAVTDCGCAPITCESASDCDGYACMAGECGLCLSDADCDDGMTCQPDGVCVEDDTCVADDDCPARQMCGDDGNCVDRRECLLDGDCGDQEACLNGQCTFAPDCEQDAECNDGFECIGGQCYEWVCRGAEDCPTDQVCDAGECVAPSAAASCFVASQTSVISEDQQIRLEAFALDASGEGVAAEFEWSSSSTDVATVDASGPFAVGQGGTGTTTITAVLANDGTSCSGEVELTGQSAVNPGDLRVVVTDADTGHAVSGAEVVLGDGDTGSTDANGVAALSAPQGAYEVSVFADDYNYVTLRDVQSDDIRIALTPRRGSGPAAGFTGEFDLSHISSAGDFTVGLAGASIAGGLLDLDLERLLGEPFMTSVSIPTMGAQDIPLPGGLVVFGNILGFDLDVKQTYYANTSGGARVGWGLAGKVPAQRLMSLFQGGGGAGDVLTTLLPMFNRFDHATKPLNLSEEPRVQDTGDRDGDGDTTEMIPDYDTFPEVTFGPHVRQSLVADVDVSNFPQMSDGEAEVAVLVGGAMLDAPGYVPLGISATSDEDGDGRPDTRELTMAPPHGSIAGGRFAVVALAFQGGEVGFEEGVELPDEFSASLWNGQSLPTNVGLGTFPDASEGTVDDATRTVTVSADAGPLFRVRLVGEERSWDVWSVSGPGSQGTFSHDIAVPSAASGRADIFDTAEVFVDAIAAQVTMDDLVRATGIGLRDAGLAATSFNRTKIR